MRALFISLGIVLVLQGCTNVTWDDETWHKMRCQQLPAADFQSCLQRPGIDYEQYKR